MTNEELILQRLDSLEAKINPLIKQANKWGEFADDLVPLQHHAVNLLIEHLQEIEAGFQLEDLFALIKQSARSVKNLMFALKTMDNIIEFVTDIEPLLKSAVPKAIEHLDELERKGVFRIIKAMMDVRAKVAAEYDGEDIDQISDGLVAMLRLGKKMSDPGTLAFLEKLASVPGSVDLDNTKKIGPFGMLSAGFNSDVKEGLGVMIALTKAMGKMKHSGNGKQAPSLPAQTMEQ
jgi:uncharacterized protein YjgD (DUF1641 family)